MTHIQKLFIQNLRYYRTQAGFSQLSFSERLNICSTYLRAVENGKNFSSLEILQNIADVLQILPYQLFLESPVIYSSNTADSDKLSSSNEIIQIATSLKQKLIDQIDAIIEMHS